MVEESQLVQMIHSAKESKKKRNFTETVEFVIVLKDIDVKKGFQLNEVIQLPKQPPQRSTICVVASGDLGSKAKSANADRVMDGDELTKIASDKRESRKLIGKYDFFLADTQLMPTVGKSLGQFMGPRGKMPSPVTYNTPIDSILEKYKDSVRVRVRNQLSLSCSIGDESMADEDLAANAMAVINTIERKLPSGNKNIKKVMIKTSMGKVINEPRLEKKVSAATAGR